MIWINIHALTKL